MSSREIECPYCDNLNEVCHDDGDGIKEEVAHEMSCCACGKSFVFYTEISLHYRPEKADCLNGSPHRFRDWLRLWVTDDHQEVQQRRCRDCGVTERRKVPKF